MIRIYTDGATSNNGAANAPGGWAYAVIDEEDNLRYSSNGFINDATNNICELMAIINACYAAEAINEQITIYSDSAYIINCYKDKWYKKWLVNGWKNSKKEPVANKELWEQLIPYFENEKYNFIKVKGHATDKWNILVDKLAVEAKNA